MAKNKKLIKFQEPQFNQANNKYQIYLKAVNEALQLIENETGIKLYAEHIKEGRAFETLLREFGIKHKDNNSLNLKPIKLMELMEVDFYAIVNQLDVIKTLPVKEKPSKDKFSIFAETPQELERLQTAQKAIELLNKMNIKNPLDLRNPIQFDTSGYGFKPSVHWIKSA